MNFQVEERKIKVSLIRPVSPLDAFSTPDLRALLEQQLAQGASHFVIDLSVTPFIDSSGVAVFVNLYKRTRARGGSVRLVKPHHEGAKRILSLTKFDRVFEMYDTPELALQF
jgi:anti-sigma B factor antagonist